MKALALSLLVVATAFNLRAEDSKILGSWKSDRETTLKFMEENAKIPEERLNALKPMFGKSTFTFQKGGKGTVVTEAYEIPMKGGKTIKVPASVQPFTYKILGETKKQVVTRVTYPETGELPELIKMLNESPFAITVFPDRNNCWTYISNGFVDLHAREYFVRVKTE